ncbi:MAG: hypothetical protein ACJ798_15150 [Phenylobacterium sp.]
MLLWVLVLGGLLLAAGGAALFLAMIRAERRARLTLYRKLGLDEATVALLMARNGDLLADLALARRQDATTQHGEPSAVRAQPSIRLVRPADSVPPAAALPPEPGRAAGLRRRLRFPGRQGRP